MKFSEVLNARGERMNLIDKKNDYADFPSYNEENSWDHSMLRDKNKMTRDDQIASVKVKFKSIAKKRHATECEKKIIEEMENDMKKYFNNVRNACTN